MSAYRTILAGVAIGAIAGGGALYLHLRYPSFFGHVDEIDSQATLTQPVAETRRAVDDERLEMLEAELAELRHQLRGLQSGQQTGRADSDLANLRSEVRTLHSSVNSLRSDIDTLAYATRPQAESGAPSYQPFASGDDAEIDMNLEQELASARLNDHFAALEDAQHWEHVDRTWSDTVTYQLDMALTQDSDLAGVTISTIDCRATRCRLEILIDDDIESEDVEFAIAGAVGEEASQMAIRYDETIPDDAARHAIVYLGRRGHDLTQ